MDGWLYGWKAIAGHCAVTVKTAIKYYKETGMPVRRGPSNKPIALAYELNRWLVSFDKKKELERDGFIYFIQEDLNDNGLIKIGFSIGFDKRFKDLQRMCPVKLKLIALQKGTIKDEKKLHERFKKHRVHGEWFKPKKIIINYINKTNELDDNP